MHRKPAGGEGVMRRRSEARGAGGIGDVLVPEEDPARGDEALASGRVPELFEPNRDVVPLRFQSRLIPLERDMTLPAGRQRGREAASAQVEEGRDERHELHVGNTAPPAAGSEE